MFLKKLCWDGDQGNPGDMDRLYIDRWMDGWMDDYKNDINGHMINRIYYHLFIDDYR